MTNSGTGSASEFAIRGNGLALVATFDSNGARPIAGLHVVTAATATGRGAPCRLVVTPDGRFAYTANAGGGSISGFAVAADRGIGLASTTPPAPAATRSTRPSARTAGSCRCSSTAGTPSRATRSARAAR